MTAEAPAAVKRQLLYHQVQLHLVANMVNSDNTTIFIAL
jgi:hypothetical protein